MDKTSSFARETVPWYDSTALCVLCMGLMALVAGFGVLGIRAGWEVMEYRQDLWVPGLLTFLSGIVMLSLAVRLAQRYARGKESYL